MGCDEDVFQIRNKQITNFYKKKDASKLLTVKVIAQSEIDPNKIYIGSTNNLNIFSLKNGQWNRSVLQKCNYSIEHIVEMNDGSLWISTALNGIIKIAIKCGVYEL